MPENRIPRRLSVQFLLAALFVISLTAITTAGELEITFTNTFDNSEQLAVSYTPENIADDTEAPLLVVAHYMSGNRFTANKSGYYPECDARGYRLVCPELHGHRAPGQVSLAALEAQHDVIDAIEYMKAKYKVDTSRIYIVGRSMGGMLSELMAAKYPDLFACAVSGEGISDFPLWMETTIPHLIASAERECGPLSDGTRFDYERRSAVNYAPNLKYVPLIMWHGTNDTWVPPEQSEVLFEAARKYNRFQPEVRWLHNASHCPANFTAKWVCDQLTYYQNVCEAGFGTPTRFYPELDIITDEAKGFFWLEIIPEKADSFARVNATLSGDRLTVRSSGASEVVIDLDKISKLTTFSTFDFGGDTGLTVKIVKGGRNVLTKTMAKDATETGELSDNLFE